MARYIPVGSAVNRAEKEGLRLLRDHLPEHYLVIGNFDLQLPQRRNTLEFDAIVIGDAGVFVVEIKGWSGAIQGDLRRWKLPWANVESPFIRNEARAKALRAFLSSRIHDWPSYLCCEALVYLPMPGTQISLQDTRKDRLLMRGEERSFFTYREHILEHSPLTPSLQAAIEECLLPLSEPSSPHHHIPDYIIQEDISRPHLPYKEYLAQHSFLRSRGRMRVKSYTLDLLLSPKHRDATRASKLSEIEALNKLDKNPYTPRAYEVIRDRKDDLVFHVVSEWLGQHTLRSLFSQDAYIHACHLAFEERQKRWDTAVHLVQAVMDIHRSDIIHRNLSPECIALTPDDPLAPIKITDFDFAKIGRFDGNDDIFQKQISLGYGAPELWFASTPHDHRVDIYSLGALLFELFTATPLYGPQDALLRHDEIWAIKRPLLAMCPPLQNLLDAMLAYHPSARSSNLQDALSLLQDDSVRHTFLFHSETDARPAEEASM